MNKRMMAALLVVGLGATACSGDTEPPVGPGGDQGGTTAGGPVDTSRARDFYDHYEEARDGDGAMPNAAPTGADSAREAGAVDAPEPMPVPPAPPGPFEDNRFEDVGDAPWVETADALESTFALDVDTGSFSVAEGFLDQGSRPDPDSIRVEEWVNAFRYGDAPPDEGAIGLTVESGAAPLADDGTALVRVGVSTQELSDEERPPANITFVIDTSGSMDLQDRLGLVKASLALLVESLRPDDTISIVTYGDSAEPVLEPTSVSDAGRILNAIEDLQPGGSTNMESGLRMGYSQAREGLREDGINVVVLASDGIANVGLTDPDGLTQEITQAGEDGIHLVTVGYGMGNYNDTLMEQLANRGDGFYSYIDTFEEAERLFVEELTPTLTVVAADSKAQVVFDEEQVARYRLIGYQNRALETEDFLDDTVDAGELGAGHQVSALYEVVPATEVDPGSSLGTVSLRWRAPDSGVNEQLDADILWPEAGESTDSLLLAGLVADTAELLKGNSVVTERGLTLEDLAEQARTLADRDVQGADEILKFIQRAQELPPAPEGGEDDWQD